MDRESRFRFAIDAVLSSGEVVEDVRAIARKYRLSLIQAYMIKEESEYYNGQNIVNKEEVLITGVIP